MVQRGQGLGMEENALQQVSQGTLVDYTRAGTVWKGHVHAVWMYLQEEMTGLADKQVWI